MCQDRHSSCTVQGTQNDDHTFITINTHTHTRLSLYLCLAPSLFCVFRCPSPTHTFTYMDSFLSWYLKCEHTRHKHTQRHGQGCVLVKDVEQQQDSTLCFLSSHIDFSRWLVKFVTNAEKLVKIIKSQVHGQMWHRCCLFTVSGVSEQTPLLWPVFCAVILIT